LIVIDFVKSGHFVGGIFIIKILKIPGGDKDVWVMEGDG
jgi:hypothetical protein